MVAGMCSLCHRDATWYRTLWDASKLYVCDEHKHLTVGEIQQRMTRKVKKNA